MNYMVYNKAMRFTEFIQNKEINMADIGMALDHFKLGFPLLTEMKVRMDRLACIIVWIIIYPLPPGHRVRLCGHRGVPPRLQEELLLPRDEHQAPGSYRWT